MRNLDSFDNVEVKNLMARECLTIYAPIAHRLGMSQIKSELEDISFRVLLPNEYRDIKIQIDQKKKEREEYINKRIEEISDALKKEGIVAHVYGRPKHFYSIYKKMKEKGCLAEDLYDLLAIRIVVDSVKDCYNSLGIAHDMYKPMPGRFKDYIAVPKTNMYQSLHTTVFGEGGKPFEIQIRTWDMHRVAENGIAAHFSYKEKTSKISEADKKIVWLRQTLELQRELADNSENLSKLKEEIFGEEVFVFTPMGDIKSFPKGSTTIDFAYFIHQKVAEKMIGAKINGRMVPINTKLENTDVIEIITSANAKGPSIDWLKYVKTASARNKITSFLKKQGKEVNIVKGKDIFEKALRKQKISKELLLDEKNIRIMLKKSGFNNIEECYENVGFGSMSILKIMNRLVEAYEEENANNLEVKEIKKDNKERNNSLNNLVIVENIDNCKVQFARCCSPIPGDEIVGYITHSNGVSVHRKNCTNLTDLNMDLRTINVSWKDKVKVDFIAKVCVKANNRDGIITDVLKCLKELKISLESINTRVTQDRENIIDLGINISDVEKLQNIIRQLKKIDSVFEVRRIR
jgi:GTP pyrophosphokinase